MFKRLVFILIMALPLGGFCQSVATTDFEDHPNEKGATIDLPFYGNGKDPIDDKTAKKLEEKGDEVYEKMWYADAVKYYEAVAKRGKDSNTPVLLEKLGNSYYFLSNLESAYKWYHQLFVSYRDKMSSQTLFRYGQSLKGVEKYNQASRVFGIIRASDADGFDRIIRSKKENPNNNTISLKPLKNNSKNSDFSPTFLSKDKLVFASARDSSIFTTRKYRWNNQPYLDLYIGEIDEETNDLNNVKKLSDKVNSKYHEAGAAFTPDGETMFFTRNNFGKRLNRDSEGVNHLTLYMSRFVGGEWSKPIPLPFNSDEYSTGHPAVSTDGKKLYFASDMPGGYGETDIYMVEINGDGTFSEPKNLGKTINSSEKEMFPFVSDNNIYFSSNRKLGFGGLDIYKSKFVDDTFEIAVNLGPPINSSSDDFSYIVDEETKKGYFASNRKGGEGDDDIYAFRYVDINEATSTLLLGVVIDEATGRATPNVPVRLIDNEGRFIKEVLTDSFGSFEFKDLTPNTRYELRAEKQGFEKIIKLFGTSDLPEMSLNLILKDGSSAIIVDGKVAKLETSVVYFDFDKYHLREEAKIDLQDIIKVWESYPNMKIKIESHTDSRGSKVYNRILSQKRADATKDYLLQLGLKPKHIESAIGYGEDKITNNCDGQIKCTERQHQNNRRSDLIITDY